MKNPRYEKKQKIQMQVKKLYWLLKFVLQLSVPDGLVRGSVGNTWNRSAGSSTDSGKNDLYKLINL